MKFATTKQLKWVYCIVQDVAVELPVHLSVCTLELFSPGLPADIPRRRESHLSIARRRRRKQQ